MANAVIMSPQQMLSEMDKALEIEIKAKEKIGSTKPHIAVDGQSCGEQNGFHLYQYSLDEPWSFEDDTPIEVQAQSMLPSRATIVSSTGTMITIATREPLPSEALKQITLLDDSIKLTKLLREGLQNNRESNAKLGLKVFGQEQSRCAVVTSSIPSRVFDPNESQRRAINLTLGSEVTYIIGPPGTGKTVTLAAIALEYLKSEQTVLIASHTNIAVDNAIKQLADMCRKAEMDNKLREGKVLRYGATLLPELETASYEDISISAIAKRRSTHLYQQKEQIETSLKVIEGDLQKLTTDNQKQQNDWENKRQQAVAQISAYEVETSRLYAIEEQRKTDLKNSKSAWDKSFQKSKQHLSTIEQQLATTNAEYVRLGTAYQKCKDQQANLTTQLAIAQQMSKIARLFKGIRLDNLEKNVSDVNYELWHIEEKQKELQEYLNQAYKDRATYESQLQQKTHYLQQIDALLNTPTKEAEHIANLQATISPWKQYLAKVDQHWEATQQYFQQQERELNNNIAGRQSRLSELDWELQEVEKRILAGAQVVATTLSKLYMSAALKDRYFDVVIVDEISAAPMPAVYIAASRANYSVVAIGDPQQLAPICTAKNSKELPENEVQLAVSWLGTDLFSKLDITLETAFTGHKACVMLDHQSRMHPQISIIARKHIYKGRLHDEQTRVPGEQLTHIEPVPGQHFVLCDTSDAFPVATNPGGHSRINVYHALCIIAIAQQTILSLGDKTSQVNKERIGIITPYNKQAKLLQRLIEDAGMKQQVRAGTVHKFQGLEFDVVIFDTVESPPIPPRQEFIASGKDAMRLINVAITRAKHKLIILANTKHIETAYDRNGGFAFPEDSILRKVIEEASPANTIHSLEILRLPSPSRIRQPQRKSEFSTELLSKLDSWGEQFDFEHFNEISFYDRLSQDINLAQKQIVIFSPFLSPLRAKNIMPLLFERRKAGIDVIIATSDLKHDSSYESIIEELKQEGIKHVKLSGEHQKFVFFDNAIAYIGSLNSLSQIGTNEYMFRTKSPKFVESLWKFIGAETVVTAPTVKGNPVQVRLSELPNNLTCKKCGKSLILKSGKFGAFYGCRGYRETGCDYTTDILEEHLKGVEHLSRVRCGKCNGPTKLSVYRKNAWLICCAPTPCNYGYAIEYVDNGPKKNYNYQKSY